MDHMKIVFFQVPVKTRNLSDITLSKIQSFNIKAFGLQPFYYSSADEPIGTGNQNFSQRMEDSFIRSSLAFS